MFGPYTEKYGSLDYAKMRTTLATFSDANPQEQASAFTALVQWGDGTPVQTASIIPGTDNHFLVKGQ